MSTTDDDGHFVFLDLSSRSPLVEDGTTMATFITNRIALKCESITINTSKQVMSHSIPGSGVIYGESKTAALDMGMTDKTLSLNGIITEQNITKNFEDSESENDLTKYLTAFEVAQLMHSYVDSSFAQANQNPNRLLILMKSRVNSDWNYHGTCSVATHTNKTDCESAGATWTETVDENTAQDDAKLIPFTYKTRNQDNKMMLFESYAGDFPTPISGDTSNVTTALKGFVRNFTTTVTPGQPFLDFSMDFQIADVSF